MGSGVDLLMELVPGKGDPEQFIKIALNDPRRWETEPNKFLKRIVDGMDTGRPRYKPAKRSDYLLGNEPVPYIIGIAGNGTKCGKSTTAKIISTLYGHDCDAFVTPLKNEVEREYGLPLGSFDANDQLKEVFRKILVDRGIERRQEDPDHLVKAAGFPDIRPGLRVVFGDVRFVNEKEAIKNAGGVTLYVQRPGLPAPSDAAKGAEGHIHSFDCDFVIWNDKDSLSSLVTEVIEAISFVSKVNAVS